LNPVPGMVLAVGNFTPPPSSKQNSCEALDPEKKKAEGVKKILAS